VRLIILPWVSSTVRRSSFPTGSQFCFCHGAEARCGRWFQDESLTFPSLWQGRSANGAQYAQCFPSLHAIMIGHDDDQSAHIFGIYSIRQPGTFGWLSALFDFSTKVYIYNELPQHLVVSTSGLLEDSEWMCIELCTYPLSLGSRA
jgi:hypothetical protein